MLAGVDFIHFKPAYGPGEKLLSAETQSNRWDGVKSHVGGCTAVAVDPAGRYFATGGVDAIAGLWTLNGAVCIRTVTRCTSAIENMSFSRGSKYLATTDGHTIDVAHLDTLSEGVTLSAPCRRVSAN
jgi:WD40 repeat protein